MTPLAGRATTGPNTDDAADREQRPEPGGASTASATSTAASTTAAPIAVSATPMTARTGDAVVRSTDTSRVASGGRRATP